MNFPSQKLLGWFRRPHLYANGDRQLHHNNARIHASWLVKSFFAKHQITQVTQPHWSPDFSPCYFWFFPKLKSPLKEKRFQTIDEIQENMTGQLMVIGRIVWGPKVPALKGTEVSLPYVQCFLYLVSSSINVSFSDYMAAYLLDRSISSVINILSYLLIELCDFSIVS